MARLYIINIYQNNRVIKIYTITNIIIKIKINKLPKDVSDEIKYIIKRRDVIW